MRAVVFEEFGEEPTIQTVPDPLASPSGSVIRVEATGLCRSDWHAWMGHDTDVQLPHVPGHELAGVIESVGSDVTNRRPGDRVTVPFVCACGRCPQCAGGNQQVCEHQTQPGFTHWGSFAERVLIENADVNLVTIPDGMSYATAAGLGCRFATAFRAVVAQGGAKPGEWVAVHGCGGVGLSAILIAVASGARVVAVDISPRALELAERFGATACIDASSVTGPVADAVREATDGGAHVSLDALGSPHTCAASVESLRRHGRHVQVGLLPSIAGDPRIPMERVIALELRLFGSHGMAAHDYAPMMGMVNSGILRPDLLVTNTIGLSRTPAELVAMGHAPGAGVTIIEPQRQ